MPNSIIKTFLVSLLKVNVKGKGSAIPLASFQSAKVEYAGKEICWLVFSIVILNFDLIENIFFCVLLFRLVYICCCVVLMGKFISKNRRIFFVCL